MLSYATGTSGKGPNVTVVREATEKVRERRPDLAVEARSSTTTRASPR